MQAASPTIPVCPNFRSVRSHVIGPALLLFGGVFLLALAIRVGATAAFVKLDSPPSASANPDQLDYELLAYHLATGRGYTIQSGTPTACRAPGTSLTLLPVYLLAGRSFTLGRLWFCTLSALTCVLAALIAARLLGARAAFLAGVALAIYPGHFYNAMHFLSEGPYCFYLSLAVLATILAIQKHQARWDLVAGAAWALAVLTRPQAIFILPLAALLILARAWRGDRTHFRRFLIQTCVMLALIAPWLVRNAVVLGKPTMTTVGGFTFWGANNELLLADTRLQGTWIKGSTLRAQLHALPPGEIAAEAAAWHWGWQFLRTHPAALPRLEAMKLYRLIEPFPDTENRPVYWAMGISWILVAPLVLIGAVRIWRRDRTGAMVLFLPLGALILCALVFYGSCRFRDSAAPVLIVLAAAAFSPPRRATPAATSTA